MVVMRIGPHQQLYSQRSAVHTVATCCIAVVVDLLRELFTVYRLLDGSAQLHTLFCKRRLRGEGRQMDLLQRPTLCVLLPFAVDGFLLIFAAGICLWMTLCSVSVTLMLLVPLD